MNQQQIDELRANVQHNCHIADARYGTDYGLCTYLLKMREYFRWEQGFGFSSSLGKEELGDWLTERESLWGGLEEVDFIPVRIGASEYNPFDTKAINDRLHEQGLVYSGGLGAAGRPHFFLGELVFREQRDGYSLMVSGRELARDLAAPPAMSREGMIFVRRESLRRMLWEKLESWRWGRLDNALGRAFACYGFERELDVALDQMTDSELELVLLHEQGECLAGDLLGDRWNRMLLDLPHTPAELAARAVRDHLADCTVTLPRLTEMDRPASIHFFMGNLSAMRKALFPALQQAYEGWRESGQVGPIRALAERGSAHWARLAQEMLQLHLEHGREAASAIHALSEQRSL
jgi:hypothetical protein